METDPGNNQSVKVVASDGAQTETKKTKDILSEKEREIAQKVTPSHKAGLNKSKNKMFNNFLEEQQKLMSKFNLTYEENLLCQLGFIFFEGLCEDPISRFRKLPLIKGKVIDLIDSLKKKGVISKSVLLFDDGDADASIFEFTEEFVSVFRTPSSELGAELLAAYPPEITVGGNSVSSNDIIEIFGSIDEFNYRYGQSVGWSKYIHTQVLDSIKWAKEQDHFGLNVTLSEFVINRVWKAIDKHQHFVDKTTGHHQPEYYPI